MMMMKARGERAGPRAEGRRGLVRDRRGALTTEYTILVGTVGLLVVFSLVSVGPRLVRSFLTTRTLLAAPFP